MGQLGSRFGGALIIAIDQYQDRVIRISLSHSTDCTLEAARPAYAPGRMPKARRYFGGSGGIDLLNDSADQHRQGLDLAVALHK